MEKFTNIKVFVSVLFICLSNSCLSKELIEENDIKEKMFENSSSFYSYLQRYQELTGKPVPTPVSSITMKAFRLVDACLKFRAEQGENNSELDLSLWQGWHIDVYESRKNNVVRFSLKESEDAEILCFVDSNYKVSEF